MTDPKRDSERIELLGGLSGEVMVFQPMRVRQISRGGMQVETSLALQLDSLHQFRLTLAGRSVVVRGRVAHSRISDVDQDIITYRSGVEFIEPSERVAAAMRAHPELVRGPMAADSLLMRELEGWTAKGGAEGLLCAGGPGGVGLALKAEDGTMRAMRPALAELLRRVGLETGELGIQPLRNSRGEVVGEVVTGR